MMSSKSRYRTFKNSITYLKNNLNLYNSMHMGHFFPKLLISYLIIIAICTCSMGFLSYRFVSTNIKEQTIKSNENLLNQFKNTVNSLILSSIDEISLKMLQDATSNPYISYYFKENIDNNIYDMTKVMGYCDTIKYVNPMIFFAGYYFEKNQLIISSNGVKSNVFGNLRDLDDYSSYYNIVNESDGITSWNINQKFINLDGSYNKIMSNKIWMVRKIQRIANSENMGGAIILSIDEAVFYNIIKNTAAQNLDKIAICDSEGIIVSHTNSELLGQNIIDLNYGDSILKTSSSSGSYIARINYIPSVVSFCSSEYNGWKYITITPLVNLTSATEFLIKIIILVSLLTSLFGILIALIPALKLSNPLKRLVSFCKSYNREPALKAGNEYKLIQSTIENLSLNIYEQEQKFKDVLPILKNNFLHALISGQYNNDRQEISDKINLFEFNFPYTRFCILVIHMKQHDITDLSDSLLIQEYEKINIASILEKIFTTDVSVCYHCEKDGNIAAVINFSTEIDVKKIYELTNSFIENEKEFSARLYIGIGEIVNDICEISKSCISAETSLKYCYIFPEKYIFSSDDIISLEESNLTFDKLLINNLINSLKAQDKNKTLNDIDIILSTLKTGKYSYSNVIEALSQCVSAIIDISAVLGISLDAAHENTSDINTQFKKIDNIIAFKNWILCLVNHFFNCIDNRHSEINNEMVQKAKIYITDNIKSRQLSLQIVAKQLHISPSHLSRIFKNTTGVTFVDYVAGLKLEYCKNLLLNTSLKIDEISSEMGYSTPQYFISRFKLKYGYTPKDFRNKYTVSAVEGLIEK